MKITKKMLRERARELEAAAIELGGRILENQAMLATLEQSEVEAGASAPVSLQQDPDGA
jgi:hypothetical protein